MNKRRSVSARLVGWWVGALLLAGGALTGVVACEGQAGRGPFTILGTVLDQDGRAVSGLRLRWLPALPGGAHPDLENIYYAIQGRTEHEVESDAAGRFVMTEVRDYFAVTSHEYLVWGSDVLGKRNPFWRVTGGQVNLARTPPGELEVALTALPAGAVRVVVAGSDGRPLEGPLPLAFGRSPRPGDDEALVVTAQFAGGEYLQGGLEPGTTWVRVLAGRRAEEIKLRNYLVAAQQAPDAPPPLISDGDVRLQKQVDVAAGQVREIRFVLP